MNTRADFLESFADELDEHAETQRPGQRVVTPLFADPAINGGTDAPGWCLKQARKLRVEANRVRKSYETKKRERAKRRK